MSVIVCVCSWLGQVTAAFFLPKWQQSGKAKRVKRNSGREVGESGVLIDFTACRCSKKKSRGNSKHSHTRTHTHKLVCFGRVPCTGSVVFLGTGIGINENTACLLFPISQLCTYSHGCPMKWSGKRGRHASLGPPWYVAQDRYRCNREGFPAGHASCEWPSA